jgi:hypothetical protein
MIVYFSLTMAVIILMVLGARGSNMSFIIVYFGLTVAIIILMVTDLNLKNGIFQ